MIPYAVRNGNTNRYFIGYMNFDSNALSFYRRGENSINQINVPSNSHGYYRSQLGDELSNISGINIIIENTNELNQYFNNYDVTNLPVLPKKVSPDIVGNTGNQSGSYDDNGNYILPNIYPVYNYGNTVINYINENDYNNFVSNANNNTDQGDTGEDTQGADFDNLIRPYLSDISQDNPNPDNPNPDNPNPDNPNPDNPNPDNPTIPEKEPTVPYPDPEQYPDATPEVNPVPDTDIAPENIPTPTPIEPNEQDITDVNSKLPAFNLADKFPFCLPFDIHKSLTLLKGSREAPYFVWSMPFGDAGEQTITVDLSPWDDVAQILRTLELLLFIVGLAVATRNLLGGE